VKNSNAGGKTPGFPQLAEIVGKPAAQKIAEWLDYRSDAERPMPNAWRDVPRRSEG